MHNSVSLDLVKHQLSLCVNLKQHLLHFTSCPVADVGLITRNSVCLWELCFLVRLVFDMSAEEDEETSAMMEILLYFIFYVYAQSQ